MKQLAALLLVRTFRILFGSGLLLRRWLLSWARLGLLLAIRLGGPLYRWAYTVRFFLLKKIEQLPGQPKLVFGIVLCLLLLLGLSDTFPRQRADLDPFSSRPLFALLNSFRPIAADWSEETRGAESDSPLSQAPLGHDGIAMLKPQILTAQGARKTVTTYTIAPGDTLSSVAERFGLTIPTLLWENKLSMVSTLRIGQTLSILPVDGIRHRVAKGDTLERIAKRYQATVEKILAFNNLKPETPLVLATDLLIPDGRPAYEPPARSRLARIERFISQSISKPVQRLGAMLWPTSVRRLTQYFSWRHPGIDIKGAMGTPVYAAGAGRVLEAGWNRGGYGNQVILEHADGKRTRYAHLSKISVAVGSSVSQGEVLGLIGSTGRSTGPHLHFEVMANGRRLNPLGLLR